MTQSILKIDSEQHSDFVWTWKCNAKSSKVSLWLPYFSEAHKVPRTSLWHLSYKGGELAVDLKDIDFIMFYGASGSISVEFLDALANHKISLIVHRRNVVHPYVFHPSTLGDSVDILTKQLVYRENKIKRCFIAKTLIKSRLANMKEEISITSTTFSKLMQSKTLESIRNIEAITTARYWNSWYERLGVDSSRRSSHPISGALDVGSKFLFGIILRWVLFHKLSPCHGFLHEPTSYPSLVYDLMEPYRYIIEKAVELAWSNAPNDKKELTELTLFNLKKLLDEVVYVPATRQYVRRKNLLHGVVLALRAYLLGEAKRLVLPTEGVKNGGRPPKAGYKMPGCVTRK